MQPPRRAMNEFVYIVDLDTNHMISHSVKSLNKHGIPPFILEISGLKLNCNIPCQAPFQDLAHSESNQH